MNIEAKICAKCKVEKEVANFAKDKKSSDGLQPKCKQCNKEYREANKNRIKSYLQQYYIDNADNIREYKKEYYVDNLEKISKYKHDNRARILESKRIHSIKTVAERAEYRRLHYLQNRDRLLLKSKTYLSSEKGRSVRVNAEQKRRSKTKNGNVESSDILQLRQNAKRCYWCNSSLINKIIHIDHYVPLARGGEHTLSNLVVSCQKCNNEKHAKDPISFANTKGKLL